MNPEVVSGTLPRLDELPLAENEEAKKSDGPLDLNNI